MPKVIDVEAHKNSSFLVSWTMNKIILRIIRYVDSNFTIPNPVRWFIFHDMSGKRALSIQFYSKVSDCLRIIGKTYQLIGSILNQLNR